MKKRTMMLLVAVLATMTSLMAQPNAKKQSITPEQKEQIKEVRDKYAPTINDIKNKIRVKQVEQKTLLASKKIDEKAVFATIDAMGELKADLHKETTALRAEMKEICPNAGQMMAYRSQRQGQKQGQGYRQQGTQNPKNAGMKNGQRPRQEGQAMRQGKSNKGMQQGAKQGQQAQRQHMQGNNGKSTSAEYNNRRQHANKGMQQGNYKQSRQGRQMMFAGNCQLSDEQKAAMAEIKKDHFWEIQETQNELALLKVKSNSVEEREASYAEVNALQTQLAKQRMTQKLELMSELTEEQRMQAISQMNHKRSEGKHHKGMRQHRNR